MNNSTAPVKPREDEPASSAKGTRRSRRFLFIYVFTLIFVSSVLVLLSYFGHIRAQEADDTVGSTNISQNLNEGNDSEDYDRY